MNVFAYFYGGPDDPLDKAAKIVFEQHGGRLIGTGTMLVGPGKGERDIQYDVPTDSVFACREALKKIGCRLEPTPYDEESGLCQDNGVPANSVI